MLKNGAVAVAIVKRQVMIVQASRTHTKRDKYLEVRPYSPFGERVFLASEIPCTRITPSDILNVFETDEPSCPASGMIELPPQAFSRYLEHSSRQQERYEEMWCAWVAKH